jgi:hypothetical protein
MRMVILRLHFHPYLAFHVFVSYYNLSLSYRTFISKLSSMSIPLSAQEALGNPKRRKAMEEEMKALQKNLRRVSNDTTHWDINFTKLLVVA